MSAARWLNPEWKTALIIHCTTSFVGICQTMADGLWVQQALY